MVNGMPDMDRLQRRQARLQARADAGNLGRRGQRRLNRINRRLGSNPSLPQDPYAGMPDPQQYADLTSRYNTAMQGIFDQLGSQGAFQPGDYSQLRQRGEQQVMDAFSRQMNPVFDEQTANLEQRLAERGIPVGSELYNRQLQQLQDTQNTARQNAMTQAYQTGAGEAQTAYNQALQQFQMPTQQASQLSPYYNMQGQMAMQQGQQGFLAGQAQLDREQQRRLAALQNKYALQQIAATPRGGGGGGGGLSYDQQLGLLDREFYNNMVMAGMQQGNQQLPSMGSGFASGLGGGITAGIAAGLGSGLK